MCALNTRAISPEKLMIHIDIEEIRAKIRALDFTRGDPEQVFMWRDDDRDSRANLTIEGMMPEPGEDALFAMMMEEAVPPPIQSQIILELLGAPPRDGDA
jgi:hypothetical protein